MLSFCTTAPQHEAYRKRYSNVKEPHLFNPHRLKGLKHTGPMDRQLPLLGLCVLDSTEECRGKIIHLAFHTLATVINEVLYYNSGKYQRFVVWDMIQGP